MGCHSTCEAYIREKAEWDRIREQRKEEQRKEHVRAKAIAEAKKRMQRGRKKS